MPLFPFDPTSGLWRAMFTPTWTQNVILAHLIIAFLAVFAYAVCNTGLGKKAQIVRKGLLFGVMLWFVRDVTGSILTYVFMPVSMTIVASWMLSGFVISIINGLVIAKIMS